jgi:hypothetical protein
LIDFLETYPQGVVTECRKISEMFVKMLPGNCDDENQAKKIECLYQKGFIDKNALKHIALFFKHYLRVKIYKNFIILNNEKTCCLNRSRHECRKWHPDI